jgi:hypothetical protein
MRELVLSLPPDRLGTPCAEGEWTVKEILLHVIDTERVVAYRALRFARNDPSPQPGFDHNSYVPNSGANGRSIDNILEEYAAVRQATLSLFHNLEDEAWMRLGTASNNPLSVRAAAYFIAGHELHHLQSIRENYG